MEADPILGPIFLSKINLAYAYTCIWVLLKYITSMRFLIPKETDSKPQLVGFHLFIPTGYVESGPFFCAATETIKYRVNNTMQKRGEAPVNYLENLA